MGGALGAGPHVPHRQMGNRGPAGSWPKARCSGREHPRAGSLHWPPACTGIGQCPAPHPRRQGLPTPLSLSLRAAGPSQPSRGSGRPHRGGAWLLGGPSAAAPTAPACSQCPRPSLWPRRPDPAGPPAVTVGLMTVGPGARGSEWRGHPVPRLHARVWGRGSRAQHPLITGLDRVLGPPLRAHSAPAPGHGRDTAWGLAGRVQGPHCLPGPPRLGRVCGKRNLASPCTPHAPAARGPLLLLGGQPPRPEGSPQPQGSAQTREPRPLAGQVEMGMEEPHMHGSSRAMRCPVPRCRHLPGHNSPLHPRPGLASAGCWCAARAGPLSPSWASSPGSSLNFSGSLAPGPAVHPSPPPESLGPPS